MDLGERVAFVTGASSGIGEAIARTLAAEGCAVALAARRADRLERIADDIDGETLVVPTDVTDAAQVEEAVAATRDALGPVDLLVNNAGISRGGPVADADLADLRRTVRVNLDGVMTTTHAVLPGMLDAGRGDVVTVSSMYGRDPQPGASAYSASKAGVNAFCDSLRAELTDEAVRVTVVMPGPVVTEMNDWEHWEGRALDPGDVAEAVRFAASRPGHVEIPELTVNSTDKLW